MLIPLFLANGVINAYIGFRHLGINLQSLPVVTVGVGFGIDYGLYIVSRAIEEYRDHLDFVKAVQRGMQTAGKAVTFTAVSLAVSTLAWGFSNIRFNSEMGLLLFLWMTISFLSTMTLLPALLVIMRRWRASFSTTEKEYRARSPSSKSKAARSCSSTASRRCRITATRCCSSSFSVMGLLLALWMAVSFLASVTLLPACLVTFQPRFLRKGAG